MNTRTLRTETPSTNSQMPGYIAVGLSMAFLGLLFLLHFLEPEFDPSWRMISEYELGTYGWLMRLAFFCWGGCVLALSVGLRSSLRTRAGVIGFGWLLVIAIAQVGAGIFVTDAITDPAKSTTGNLHTICGVIVILTFPIAATLVARGLSSNPQWQGFRQPMNWLTFLVWLGLIAYFGSIIVSNLANATAGRVGPHVLQGWPNRAMVTIYSIWLISVAWHAARNVGASPMASIQKT